MTIKAQDVLKADLVLVGVEILKSAAELEQFRECVNADVRAGTGLATNEFSGETHSVRTFTLNRDRIVLTSLPDRSLVVKEYPSLEDPELEWERLAQVATCAIESTEDANRAPRAFGFNYEWVFDVGADETAAGLLGERLLNQQSFTKEGWKLVGGGGTLMYSDGNRRWTFHTQPRPNGDPKAKRVFLGLNLHVEEPRTPSANEIRRSLEEIWTEAHSFMMWLRRVE